MKNDPEYNYNYDTINLPSDITLWAKDGLAEGFKIEYYSRNKPLNDGAIRDMLDMQNQVHIENYESEEELLAWKTRIKDRRTKAEIIDAIIYYGTKPVGMADSVFLSTNVLYLEFLYIHKQHRGLGLGKKLLTGMITYAYQNGFIIDKIKARVQVTNPFAQKILGQLGFEN